MNNDLLNILTSGDAEFDSQKLIDYINGKLSAEEKHEVEQWMADNHIANDAIEGLQNIRDKKDLPLYIEQLNKNLHDHLQKKKEQRSRKKIKEYPWIYFAVVLVILLCVLGYYILRMMLAK